MRTAITENSQDFDALPQQAEAQTTNRTFKMTLTGRFEQVEDAVYLTAPDRSRWRVAGQLPSANSADASFQQWEVVPRINSDGLIATVQIVGAADRAPQKEDTCELLGRVVQLGKRTPTVLFKVSRAAEKTLRLTLLDPPPQMKADQLWQVLARRQGNYLHVVSASLVDELPEKQQQHLLAEPTLPELPHSVGAVKRIVQRSKQTAELKDSDSMPAQSRVVVEETFEQTTARLMPIAHLALFDTTELSGWILNPPVQRGQHWEWEALLPQVDNGQPLKARVQVNPYTEEARAYQYSQFNDLDEPETNDLEDKCHTDRLTVTPLGAARSIGASCFRVEIGPYEIVLDAGTRPKGNNPLPAFEVLKNPNLILITHAHQDHIGALPVFHRQFPGTPMICTSGTREIAEVMLTDCLKVQQAGEDFAELFDEIDLNETLFRLETQPVGVDFEPLPGLQVRFIHAGHIVGAACIYLRYGSRSLLYTGDYNTTSSRTTDGLRLADLPEADILITESTYGADTHPSRKAQETELLKAVAEVVQAGGNVLIPAFALGRAQEIILAIRTSAMFHNLNIPVYVDGLVRAVTDVFNHNLDFLPATVQNFAQQQEPFFNPDGKPRIMPIGHPRERPLAIAKPSVIIASSGMLSGGASVYYGQALLERDNAAIFISGYTDEESPGRFLQGLKKGDEIELEGKKLTVRATVKRFNLSAHADKIGLTQVIHKVNPKHLILIHGSPNALHELAQTGDIMDKYIVHIPPVGEAVEYGVVPEHITPARLARIESPQEFEVSLEAEVEGAWLRLPEAVMADPRWAALSATGILKAKWTGSGLNLTPVNHRQIAIEAAIGSGTDCCAACEFFDKRYCQCPESPLFTRSVDPTGNCLEFRRVDSENGDVNGDVIYSPDIDADSPAELDDPDDLIDFEPLNLDEE